MLLKSRASWKIVVGHHGIVSYSEKHGSQPELIRVRLALERLGAIAYLNGHDHNLQHVVPTKTVNTPGAKAVAVGTSPPARIQAKGRCGPRQRASKRTGLSIRQERSPGSSQRARATQRSCSRPRRRPRRGAVLRRRGRAMRRFIFTFRKFPSHFLRIVTRRLLYLVRSFVPSETTFVSLPS